VTGAQPSLDNARELTGAMLEALGKLYHHYPSPATVSNAKTAIALLNRGFMEAHTRGAPIHTLTLYHITQRGATAYRITAKQAGIILPDMQNGGR
jgi:hypothetical protein